MQILERHNIEIEGVERSTPEIIKIKIINDIPPKSVSTTCGCTKVARVGGYYEIALDPLPELKWYVDDPKTQTHIKTVRFTLHQENFNETVTIKIKITNDKEVLRVQG